MICKYRTHCNGRLLEVVELENLTTYGDYAEGRVTYADGSSRFMIDQQFVADDVAVALIEQHLRSYLPETDLEAKTADRLRTLPSGQLCGNCGTPSP